MMRRSYVLIVLLAVFGLSFCLFGCDCSDGDDGDECGPAVDDDSTLAEVDQATAETALPILALQNVSDDPVRITCCDDCSIDDVFDRIRDIVNHIDDIINGFFSKNKKESKNTTMFLRAWAMQQVKDAILSGTVANQKSELLTGSTSGEASCKSGSYQAVGSWTGPDKPTMSELCDVSDIEMTITFDSCQELGVTANGGAKISLEGSLCSPQLITVGLNDFDIAESKSGMEIAFNKLNMVATVDLPEGQTNVVNVASVINGDMTLNDVGVEYKDYKEEATFTKENVTISAKGSIKSSCVDGWLEVQTVSPVSVNYGDCPNGGEVKFSGNGDKTATFNSDGSVTVGETTFDSCTDLPAACQ